MHVNHADETLLAKLNTSCCTVKNLLQSTVVTHNACNMQHMCSVWHLAYSCSWWHNDVFQHSLACAVSFCRDRLSVLWGHAVHTCGVMQCTHVGSCSAHTTVVISSHAYCKHGACHIGKVNIHCFLLKQSVTAIVNAVAFPCVAAALQ